MVKLTDHGVVLAADGTFAAAENCCSRQREKQNHGLWDFKSP